MNDLTILLIFMIVIGIVALALMLWTLRPELPSLRREDPEPGPDASLLARWFWQVRNKTPEEIEQWEKDNLPPVDHYGPDKP